MKTERQDYDIVQQFGVNAMAQGKRNARGRRDSSKSTPKPSAL